VKQNLDRVKEQFTELLQLNSQNQKIYLVGGVVRDQILGRKKKDIDILCEKDSRSIAKHWAEIKRGAFYILDEQRNTCRVILNEAGQKTIYDFATQQGHDLLDDLSARDFTLNAMAIEFSAPDVLIDPLGGIADIEHSLLKACSAASFSSDPVRTIRAIRYANAYQLKIDPDTLQSLKARSGSGSYCFARSWNISKNWISADFCREPGDCPYAIQLFKSD
jgi:tRNA nucleotidyltransferase/poly(A) polymerase